MEEGGGKRNLKLSSEGIQFSFDKCTKEVKREQNNKNHLVKIVDKFIKSVIDMRKSCFRKIESTLNNCEL